MSCQQAWCSGRRPALECLVFRPLAAYGYPVDENPKRSAPQAGIWKLLDTWSGRVALLAALVVGLGTVAGGVYGAWGWITSRFEDEPPPAKQSGELALHSFVPRMTLRAYLKNHPEIETAQYVDHLSSLGVQVRVTIHLVGFGEREVEIRVSDPRAGSLGASKAFEPPVDDFRGEVDHWAPYSRGGAQAYIELVDVEKILASVTTELFRVPTFECVPPECFPADREPRPPGKLLVPVLVETP